MKKLIKLFLILPVFVVSCGKSQPVFIPANNSSIEYMGRIGLTDSAKEIYWPGTSVKIYFKGTSVKALLQDEHGDNYFNVIIDGDSIFMLRPDTTKKYYTLAENLPNGKHSVELFKRTEWNKGKTWFYGFQLYNEREQLYKPEPKKRMIEFYGNSITAGYGIEDFKGDSPDSIFTNNYLTYGALTARHYDAEYSCIAKGGIGIMVSWFPLIMPEMYKRLNPADNTSLWDFSKKTPDIVVINLFQNDSWIVNMTDNETYKYRFGNKPPPDKEFIINAYKTFVQQIRDVYPNAHIICTLGSMDITRKGSPWPGYVEDAVNSFEDEKIYVHFFPYKKTSGHPEVKDHAKMAKSLIKFIDGHIEW
jgi:hypothetical protein